MPFSDEHKCIFVHVPKTGGSSIENILQMDRTKNLYHRRNKIDGVSPQHLPINSIRKQIGEEKYKNYFKFCFFRNPWDKMVSEFFYRKAQNDWPRNNEALSKMSWDTFNEFLDNIFVKSKDIEDWDEVRKTEFDGHLEPQLSFIGDIEIIGNYQGIRHLQMNFVGFYESLQRDFDFLMEKHLNKSVKELPRVNVGSHLHYTHYYNDTTRRLVEEAYKEDIQANHYVYEGCSNC